MEQDNVISKALAPKGLVYLFPVLFVNILFLADTKRAGKNPVTKLQNKSSFLIFMECNVRLWYAFA